MGGFISGRRAALRCLGCCRRVLVNLGPQAWFYFTRAHFQVLDIVTYRRSMAYPSGWKASNAAVSPPNSATITLSNTFTESLLLQCRYLRPIPHSPSSVQPQRKVFASPDETIHQMGSSGQNVGIIVPPIATPKKPCASRHPFCCARAVKSYAEFLSSPTNTAARKARICTGD
jgi:hypothetical protein